GRRPFPPGGLTMATEMEDTEVEGNFAALLERLGGIPLERIRTRPAPGTATEEDVLAAAEGARKRVCELVEGVLVEKARGTRESLLGGALFAELYGFVRKHKLGKVLPGDGTLRLMPGSVRVPDVSFISWAQMPGGKFPEQRLADLYPDLAVEILSEGNTKA